MSETLDAEYLALKGKVDELRKKDRLPYWRLAYAEFSLSRIGDYIAVGGEEEAHEMILRLDRWVDEHEKELARSTKPAPAKVSLWNAASIEKELAQIQTMLNAKNYLIPVAERISFSHNMDRAKELLSKGKFDGAYAELFSLRSQLISRLHRSYRARAAMILYSQHTSGFGHSPSGAVVGPYNAEHTLENALSLVGERDAIWVEDFLELYDSLSKITERLAPQERKRRS
jgi:hypothetical protein